MNRRSRKKLKMLERRLSRDLALFIGPLTRREWVAWFAKHPVNLARGVGTWHDVRWIQK